MLKMDTRKHFDMIITQQHLQEIKIEPGEWSDFELKQEVYEDDSPGSAAEDDSNSSFEEANILNIMNNNNNIEDDERGGGYSINVKNEMEMYQVTIKTERLENYEDLDILEYNSLHYDSLVVPERVKCKWCYRIFKNNYELFEHNIVHMKVNLTAQSLDIKELTSRHGKYKGEELYHCTYCNSTMKHNNWQRHMETVHSSKEFGCDLCAKRFRCVKYLKKHMSVHEPRRTADAGRVRCEQCGKVFKHKYNLYCHVRNCHSNEELQCDMCDGVFKSRPYLLQHVKRIHQDYGKLFVCWCGKDFLTPRRLSYHKRNQHG